VAEHGGAGVAGDARRRVGRAVVDDEHVERRGGLAQLADDVPDGRLLVVRGHDREVAGRG
jgi:hypothetical protein